MKEKHGKASGRRRQAHRGALHRDSPSENGEGWIDHSWQRPGSSEPSRRFTFVKKATFEGRSYIVGSSFYADDYILCRNLSECTYLEEPGNIRVVELLNPGNINRTLDLNYSIAHSVIEPPGEHIAPHLMKNPEVHYILKGKASSILTESRSNCVRTSSYISPAGAIQTTYNTGNTTLKFLAINQPDGQRKILKSLNKGSSSRYPSGSPLKELRVTLVYNAQPPAVKAAFISFCLVCDLQGPDSSHLFIHSRQQVFIRFGTERFFEIFTAVSGPVMQYQFLPGRYDKYCFQLYYRRISNLQGHAEAYYFSPTFDLNVAFYACGIVIEKLLRRREKSPF